MSSEANGVLQPEDKARQALRDMVAEVQVWLEEVRQDLGRLQAKVQTIDHVIGLVMRALEEGSGE